MSAAASSGLPVSFAAGAGGSCSVSSAGLVSGLALGTCTVVASQGGSTNYSPAPPAQRQTAITAPPGASQVIAFSQPATPATFGNSFLVNPAASSGLPVALAAAGVFKATAAGPGFEITMTSGTGSCTLTAAQAGDGVFLPAADVVWVVEATRARPTVTATGELFTYDAPPRAARARRAASAARPSAR